MFWGKGPEKPPAPTASTTQDEKKPQDVRSAAPDGRSVAGFDPGKLPERERLPAKLQTIVDRADKEDNFYDDLVTG
jgi:mitochondrial fission process protein 1